MSTLRNTIDDLASQFAAGVLNAIRSASLEDILAETNRSGAGLVRRGPGRPKGTTAAPAAEAAEGGTRARRGRKGRLGRRSADDIGQIVERIVTLLGQSPSGLRAEEIRAKLGLEAKELPRPIAEALASKKIVKQGQKRATTYFAKGAAPAAGAGGATSGGKKAGKKAGGGKRGKAKGAKKAGGGKRGRKAAAAAAQANGAATEAAAT